MKERRLAFEVRRRRVRTPQGSRSFVDVFVITKAGVVLELALTDPECRRLVIAMIRALPKWRRKRRAP